MILTYFAFHKIFLCMAGTTVLENHHISVGFSPSGDLISFVNKKTACEFIAVSADKKEAESQFGAVSPWKLIISSGECDGYPVNNLNQHPSMTRTGTRLDIIYDSLCLNDDGGSAVPIKLSVSIVLNGDSLIWQATLENSSQWKIVEFWFPLIAGLKEIDKQSYVLLPLSLGAKVVDPKKELPVVPWSGFSHTTGAGLPVYPSQASMCWMEFCSDRQGLFLGSMEEKEKYVGLLARKNLAGTYFYLGFVEFPHLSTGQKWQSLKYVVALHEGDWHDGAKKYRAGVNRWLASPNQTPWVKEMPGWVFDAINAPFCSYPAVFRRFEEIPDRYDIAGRCGLDTVMFYGGWRRFPDERYPDCLWELDAKSGARADLEKAIDRIHHRDGRIVLATAPRWISAGSRSFETHGSRMCHVDMDGLPYTESYFTSIKNYAYIHPYRYPIAVGCPASYEWRRILFDSIRFISQFGPDCIYLEQSGMEIGAYPCFSREHGHSDPMDIPGQKLEVLKEARQICAESTPSIALCTEGICDLYAPYFDFHLGWPLAYPKFRNSIFGLFRAFPEMYRYTFPEHIVTNRPYVQTMPAVHSLSLDDLIADFSFNFVLGLRMDVETYADKWFGWEHPAGFFNYLAKLSSLAKRHKEYLLFGSFMDTDGLVAEPSGIVAKVFRKAGTANCLSKRAIAVWNPLKERVTTSLKIQRRKSDVLLCRLGTREALSNPPKGDIRFSLSADEVVLVLVE